MEQTLTRAKRDLTMWFVVLVLVVVLCGSIGIYWQQRTHNQQWVEETARGSQMAFDRLQQQETAIMQVALGTLGHMDTLRAAYLRQGRDALQALAAPLLAEFSRRHGITHLYFHQPDQVNFLRVHQPDRYGDRIERHTLRQARQGGQPVAGLELGPMGMLVLRAVTPWYDQGRLIGFLELGTEIGRLATPLQKQFHADILLFVAKEHLQQTEWSLGMQMLGRSADWHAFADHVLIQQTTTNLPPFLKQVEMELAIPGEQTWHNAPWDDDHFNIIRLPILDNHDREIAFLVIVQNATAQIHQSQRIIALGIVVGILGGLWLITLFGKLLDRLDARLATAYAGLRDRDARLRLTQEYALDAIITIDAQGRVVELNPAAEALFGYARETLLGQDIADYIIPPALRPAHKEALLRHASQQGEWVNLKRKVDLPGVRADGHIIDMEVGLISLSLSGQRYYTAFLHDVTERKQLLKSLQETLTVAESANRLKSEFLANMSHEIRTPMNTIIGMTDLILTVPLAPQEQRNNLEIVLQSALSLLGLINNILDFSKMDAGMIALERIPFDLSGQLENVCNTLAIKAHQKGVALYCDLAPNLPVTAVGDPLRLRQVLVNLVNNAIKFTADGEVVLRVERAAPVTMPGHPVDAQGLWLRFAVSDTGIGIPRDKIPAIFEQFTQVDGSTTRLHGGTGLGLSISKHLVRLMGGEIAVESTVGQGSLFHFVARFGVAERSRSAAVHPEREERRGEPTYDDLAGVRVLLADGHATGRAIVRTILSAVGMVVTEAVDADSLRQQRTTAMANGQPDALLILDHGLADADFSLPGTLEQPGEDREKILLLLPSHISLASFTPLAHLQNARAAGKPVFKHRLLKTIRHLLSDQAATESGIDAPPAMTRQGPPLTILLVEDNPNNQQLATAILAQVGHTVTIANHGREALTLLQTRIYDLILMDLQMPEMDGLEVTRQIRQVEPAIVANPRTPIIAVTAKATGDEEAQCLAVGMDGYLRKPYRSQDLLNIIDRIVRQRQQQATPPTGQGPAVAVLKEIGLDASAFTRQGTAFVDQFPRHLHHMEQAVADQNALLLAKWVKQLGDLARAIGAWQVPLQAMRLRGQAEQNHWTAARETLTILAAHCQAAQQAIQAKESNSENIDRG
ncbi:MAG: response regulator [Magnetococcus sp. DMHC-8]